MRWDGSVVRILRKIFKRKLDVQNGRRITLKSIPLIIIKDLKCLINRNIVLQFERHKPNTRPNNIIIANVAAVTSVKHSGRDPKAACFVRLRNLYIT
jgi:hypothetical protein